MDDHFRRYAAPPTEKASIPRTSFPGYLSSEASMLTTNQPWSSVDFPGGSSDFLQRDILPSGRGAYAVDGIASARSEPGPGGLAAPLGIRGYEYPLEDPSLLGSKHDVAPGIGSRVPDLVSERHGALGRLDDLPVAVKESNILFVDGLPTDCSRREVGHLFRPFIGFGEIKVVHKEPRRSGDKARVLCFVEFADAKCALTAMEALQGYKFDDKKPESPELKIHFAHFPFRLPSDHDEQRLGGLQ